MPSIQQASDPKEEGLPRYGDSPQAAAETFASGISGRGNSIS
jgi:hypothetical protein